MLYSKAAGPGDSSPSPSTYHILGSSRHGFAHLHYIVGVQFLQPFSRFFAVFRPFLHHFLHFWPPGPTCRAELGTGTQNQGAGNHKTPWVGAKKNHAPGGVAGRAQHSAGAGDGLAPPSQGRSAAQRQRGGTRRAGGETGARGQQTGDRAAQRRGRPADEAGPRRGGTPCPRKRAALCADRPPTADAPRGCAARGKRVGVVAPPRARNQPGQTLQRRPATGGARPHPAPRCRFVVRGKQRTGPRPQVALVDERPAIPDMCEHPL